MKRPDERPRAMWRRLGTGLLGCLLISVIFAGCTSVRSSLGTSAGPCYLALPTATRAVNGHGRLVGVQLLTLSAIHREAPGLFDDLATTHADSQRVCVIAFAGHFSQQSVADPRGLPVGRLAIVVSTTPANQLLGTVIALRSPLRLGHSHIG